jgi:hypothetical protein
MKHKICIVIATKDSNHIIKCLESTKIISVPFDLYIVDNDSSDQQYFKTAEQFGTLIKNDPTYELGAFWKAIEYISTNGSHSSYTHYMLMQDSMIFVKDLDLDLSQENTVYSFNQQPGWVFIHMGYMEKEGKQKAIDFGNISGIDVSRNNFKMFQCCTFICTKHHLSKLKEIKLDLFKPTCKRSSELAERIIGLSFDHINSDLSPIKLESKYVQKIYASRD